MKKIVSTLVLLSLFFLQVEGAFAITANETQATANIIKVQWAVTSWTPPAPSTPPWMSQKGYVWEILARIFDGNQKITNYFILALQSIMGGNNNNVPKWNGSQFIVGTITDRSWKIWIWNSNPSQKLDISWNIIANRYIWDGSTITNINGDNIQNGTVDGTEIQDNSITAIDIAVNSINDSEINNSWNFSMNMLTLSWTPINNNHVVTKWYVDSLVSWRVDYWQVTRKSANTERYEVTFYKPFDTVPDIQVSLWDMFFQWNCKSTTIELIPIISWVTKNKFVIEIPYRNTWCGTSYVDKFNWVAGENLDRSKIKKLP